MNFINPIEILELQNYDISDIDNIIIKKAKRKAIAEIELSDEGYLNYKGYKIIKSDVERVINELEDKEKIEFYSFISNNPKLNLFLTTGNESIFLSYKQESIYKLPNFINFISSYFAISYDKALYKSFKTNNEVLLQRIISVKPLVKDSDLEICYKSISNSIKENITEIDQLTSDIKNEESIYDEFDIQDVYDIVLEKLNVKIINLLPIYFQSIRNKSANSIRNLSVNIFNTFDDSDLALDIINYALEFKVDGLTEQNLNTDYEQIYKINNEREELEINAPILKKYASLLIELKNKMNDYNNKLASSFQIYNWVRVNIKVEEINSLSEIFNEIRNSIIRSLRDLSVSCWNNYKDFTSSLAFIDLSLSLNSNKEVKSMLYKDRDDLIELNEKYKEYYNCWFCGEKLADSNCGLIKKVYKVNKRSGIVNRSVQYSQKDLKIPRCENCKDIHQYGAMLFIGSLISGIILPIIIFQLKNSESNFSLNASILGVIICGIFGTFIKYKYFKSKNVKSTNYKDFATSPIVKEHIRYGWRLDRPTA